jgi:hypothetical protein
LRKLWREQLDALAFGLTLHAHTPLPDALAVPMSDAARFFESKAWKDAMRAEEGKIKLQTAMLSGINEQIRGIGILVKAVARSR